MLIPLIFSKSFLRGKNSFCLYSPHGFSIDGVRWATADHFLRAQRYAGTPLAEAIRLTPSILEADKLVRAAGQTVRTDWVTVEDELMYKALLAKFRAHPTLRALLLATGKQPLIEEPSFEDRQRGFSRNRLGFALMRVRSSLCRSEAQKRRKKAA